MNTAFRTKACYLSGAICGNLWMPDALAGKPVKPNCRGPWGFFQESSGWTFRDALLSLLMAEGGDFQNAQFAADTVIRIERVRIEGPGKYSIHVWEREVSKLPDCADLVNDSAYSSDFFGED